jgi:triosephosphate isomerase (TIM)
MKDIIIAGNWKSNKSISEAELWMKAFAPLVLTQREKLGNTKIIICSPFLDLTTLKHYVDELDLPIELGAQDVSPFPEGAYTGEVTAKMLTEVSQWVIVGHSERRKYLHEADEELVNETKRAKEAGLKVIYCVSDDQMLVPAEADVIGYEPTWAIGTGKTDTPENANSVITNIKAKFAITKAVYGGSVTADNVATFMGQPAIDGALIGGASLDPAKFMNLIINASSI